MTGSTELTAPVFILGAPQSGDATLLLALAHASGVWHVRTAAPTFLDGLDAVAAAASARASHRLTAEDADSLGDAAREALTAALVDREGAHTGRRGPGGGAGRPRGTAGAPRPVPAAAFPDSHFVFVARDPEEATPEMLAVWHAQTLVSAPELPGWEGPPWSLPLIPGWRELEGRPLEQIVVAQWTAITDTALDDLASLPAERVTAVGYGTLIADPRAELRRLCNRLGIPYDQALLSPLEQARRVRGEAPPAPEPALAAALPAATAAAARARALLVPAESPAAPPAPPKSPLGSVSTGSFAERLREPRQLAAGLDLPDRQADLRARQQGGGLNTHFRDYDKPMGSRWRPDVSPRAREPRCGISATCPRWPRRSSRRAPTTPATCRATAT